MKITIERAVGMFNAIKKVSYKEVKCDKVSLIWLRLYPLAKEWDDFQATVQKDIEEARTPIVKEFQALKEDEQKSKEQEFIKKLNETINNLPSVKSQHTKLNEEKEVDLPTLTEDEFLAISKSSAFETIGDAGILYDLVVK